MCQRYDMQDSLLDARGDGREAAKLYRPMRTLIYGFVMNWTDGIVTKTTGGIY